MSRINIEIDDELIRKATRLTRLKTKRQIVHRALDCLVKAEGDPSILRQRCLERVSEGAEEEQKYKEISRYRLA